MLATRQLYLDGVISKDVYVAETRNLYSKAQQNAIFDWFHNTFGRFNHWPTFGGVFAVKYNRVLSNFAGWGRQVVFNCRKGYYGQKLAFLLEVRL